MIGLDTNILIRHIVQDDPLQSPKATHLIENQLSEANPAFISVVTIAETVWVLTTRYQLSSGRIADVVQSILQTDVFIVQNEQQVHMAMEALRSGQASFPDALIVALGLWSGCSSTYTFDRKASRLAGFELL